MMVPTWPCIQHGLQPCPWQRKLPQVDGFLALNPLPISTWGHRPEVLHGCWLQPERRASVVQCSGRPSIKDRPACLQPC